MIIVCFGGPTARPRIDCLPLSVPGLIVKRKNGNHGFERFERSAQTRSDDRLVYAADITTGRFVERGASLFGKRTLKIESSSLRTVDQWWQRLCELPGTADEFRASKERSIVQVSPPLNSEGDKQDGSIAPWRDHLVFCLAEQLTALHVRKAGNIWYLMLKRLDESNPRHSSTRILLGEQLSQDTRDELLRRGCVGWFLARPVPTTIRTRNKRHRSPGVAVTALQSLNPDEFVRGEWLVHCTRRRVGPWPAQSEAEYLDELILEEPKAERSEIAALGRIVEQQRLIGSNEGIRGKTPVVCFTAVPLGELQKLNVFRPHRGRWDFQPYGLCIAREWLERQKARPVRYSDGSQWQQLTEGERPFFQLERSGTRTGNQIDWTMEEEWRVVGDVDLAGIPADSIAVFVPTLDEGLFIRELTKWSVCILRDDTDAGTAPGLA